MWSRFRSPRLCRLDAYWCGRDLRRARERPWQPPPRAPIFPAGGYITLPPDIFADEPTAAAPGAIYRCLEQTQPLTVLSFEDAHALLKEYT